MAIAGEGQATDLDQALEGFSAPDISEKEYAEHWAGSIANGLEATRLCKVIEVKSAPGQVHNMCRVKKEHERHFVHNPVKAMLFRLRGIAEVFFGKEFFLTGPGKDDPDVWDGERDPDEMGSDEHVKLFAASLEATGLAEVVQCKHAPGQIHLMCRVKKDLEKIFIHGPIKGMLIRLRGKGELFVGKEFFLKDNSMVYAWVISLTSEDLARAAPAARDAFQNFRDLFDDNGDPIIREGDPKMVYAWVLSFGAEDLQGVVKSVSEALAEVAPKRRVTEAPLLGPGTPTGSLGRGIGTAGSKGAAPIRG